jgi:hypothetical protein
MPTTCDAFAEWTNPARPLAFTGFASWTSKSGAKIARTSQLEGHLEALNDANGRGWRVLATPIEGSYVGGTIDLKVYFTGYTAPRMAAAYSGPRADSSNITLVHTANVCEPHITVAYRNPGTPAEAATATVRPGPGIKRILLGGASTITVNG